MELEDIDGWHEETREKKKRWSGGKNIFAICHVSHVCGLGKSMGWCSSCHAIDLGHYEQLANLTYFNVHRGCREIYGSTLRGTTGLLETSEPAPGKSPSLTNEND